MRSTIDKGASPPLKWPDRRSLVKRANRERGTDFRSKSAAAPATVSGEPEPHCHWGIPREGGEGLRPASQETCRRSGRSPGRGASVAVSIWRKGPIRRPRALSHPNRRRPEERLQRGDSHRHRSGRRRRGRAAAPSVYVCVTCRHADDPEADKTEADKAEDAPRPGLVLARAAARAAKAAGSPSARSSVSPIAAGL